MPADSIAERLPDLHDVVRGLVIIVSSSLLVGVFLFHIWVGLDHLLDRWPTLLMNIYFSSIYATVMYVSLTGTIGWLQNRVSIHSRTSVVLHAGILSMVTILSYGLATGICRGLHPNFSIAWEVLLVTGTVAFLVTLLWSAFMYLNQFYQELREAEAAKYEARLEALRAQINPHFLFNAFNSIAALIRTRPDEAETVVEDLADLFRYTLRASKSDMSTLHAEIRAAHRYLAVEKARFRDRLSIKVDVPDSLQSTAIPSMTIQPLVENAVKHGVGQTHEDCTVTITARRKNGRLVLRVTDTGPGFEETDLDAVLDDGTGLSNVYERLQLFFGEEAQMHLRARGVELWIPLEAEGNGTTAPAAMAETG